MLDESCAEKHYLRRNDLKFRAIEFKIGSLKSLQSHYCNAPLKMTGHCHHIPVSEPPPNAGTLPAPL
jgi:hypothetical protein